MNMSTTTTVQRDDAAECRAAFEAHHKNKYGDLMLNRDGESYWYPHAAQEWALWQAAWKAAKGV